MKRFTTMVFGALVAVALSVPAWAQTSTTAPTKSKTEAKQSKDEKKAKKADKKAKKAASKDAKKNTTPATK